MQVPLEITFREVRKTAALQELIKKEAAKLERVCSYIMSCRLAVEQLHRRRQTANPFRVRLDLMVPPSHEIVVLREPATKDAQPLPKVLRSAFTAAQRQLKKLVAQQRGAVKTHPQQEMTALVYRLFPEEDYGFLKTLDDREIYFHRNSVLNDGFARLEIGTGVRFVEEEGEKGYQATTVQIVDKRGSRVSEGDVVEPPLGWK